MSRDQGCVSRSRDQGDHCSGTDRYRVFSRIRFLCFNIKNTQKDMKMLNSKNLAISSFKTQILLAFKNLNING